MRLFLCDDNVHYRMLARRVLEKGGHTVIGEAGDGEEALATAPATEPDVLLLDLNMPRMNGFAALPLLRQALPQTQIIILTTGQAPAERQQALDAGAHAFIVKPDRIMSLGNELDAALASTD
jgi:two-component system chemotaxis response regulator CheY